MADIVIMPKLGFDMAEGTLVRWVTGEGERVEKGAILAEIETDKATVEVESAFSGVVRRYLVDENSIVPVGEPIAIIGDPDEEIDLESLLGKVSDKNEIDKTAPSQGEKVQASTDDVSGAQQVEDGDSPTRAKEKLPPMDGGEMLKNNLPEGVRASPLARRIAEERGIDLRQINGSGPEGRIVKKDVEMFEPVEPSFAEQIPETPPQEINAPREDRRIPLSRLRSIIGRRMAQSFQQSPHFFVTHEYDVDLLLGLRQEVNSWLPEEAKISVNDFIIKAVALTLREFPNLNASLDEEKNEVIHHGNINIGVAVAVESGLLTVVCQNTDLKPLRQIAKEVREMVSRAREGKVRPEDIEGSTFSVSNLGMFDVDQFTAIINPPEAAILAVGSAQQIPVVVDGEIKPATRMKATISIDHRVSDGAEAALFLQTLARYLEEPLRLLV